MEKEYDKKSTGNAYIIAYFALIPLGIYNVLLCSVGYGFFGVNTGVIASFFNSMFIAMAIIFLAIKNMYKKKNMYFLRIISILIVMTYPIIISIAQIFSLFEFKGIPFDINTFSIFQDTYIFLNIPLLLLVLIATNRFNKQSY